MGIFSRFFRKSQKSEPSDNNDEISNRSVNYGEMIAQKSGFFREDGVWEIERDCTREYNMGTDSLRGGCGLRETISEYDINGICEIYTWSCRICGTCHAIPGFEIPEEVKERIRHRSALKREKNPIVIDFREYKRKKTNRENTKKSNE